ncbi:TPA: hypothetical protein HH295_13120 [Xanthomonas vasicola pv. zeae]|uniref:Uncharacterized protein n=5 Tax=Xanthomonas vasicola TaxID=56459 RepID=A0A836P5T9_XANVA|nr:hypothetical protein [Xanthomonas vasicola]AZR27660.1 hypothetical protein NX80_015720 [Xanthomonas vasicola pv. arecae]KEZ96805.1 hypothetical protein A11M_0113435 [Xanthomonas vasicola pv. vasculorum NCPPB 895]KFA32202.1 hypothetical protein KW5_0100685 [Xanthomonas vasicola pv. vasculorum NCPPB 1326]MBV6747701.1 hypothetical protein [Xanthomonas vasicola pv. vasculorum NCPPB 890]HHZ31578.1 hypothetical protein [Xanthomonas vasicola pv. zeae]
MEVRMFLMPFLEKNKQKSEMQVAADKQLLKSINEKKSLRVIDGTLRVDAGDVEDTMRTLQKTAKSVLYR